jgi:hypothetical protein
MDGMRHSITVSICMVTCFVFVQSCKPALVPEPTSIPLPTPTPLPEKMPPPLRIWEGITIKTTCLESKLTLSQNKVVSLDPIGETVRNILVNMGMQVVDQGATCDATLSLITQVEPINGFYIPGGTCYTGGNLNLTISLFATGQEAYEKVISVEQPVAETVSANWCEEHKQPEDFLEQRTFTEMWSEPFLDILADLWGPQAIAWTLDQLVTGWPNFVSKKLKAIGPTDEIVQALIYALQAESDDLRKYAAMMIEDFTPEAEEAIPFLAQAVKNDINKQSVAWAEMSALERFYLRAKESAPVLIEVLGTESIDSRTRKSAHRTLVAITGQEFGMNPQEWLQWWESEQALR